MTCKLVVMTLMFIHPFIIQAPSPSQDQEPENVDPDQLVPAVQKKNSIKQKDEDVDIKSVPLPVSELLKPEIFTVNVCVFERRVTFPHI